MMKHLPHVPGRLVGEKQRLELATDNIASKGSYRVLCSNRPLERRSSCEDPPPCIGSTLPFRVTGGRLPQQPLAFHAPNGPELVCWEGRDDLL
jgi:hypothetical protein